MISLIQLKKLCSNVLISYAIYSKCLNLLCEEDVEETPPDQIFSTYAQAKIINVDDSFVEHNSSTSQVVLWKDFLDPLFALGGSCSGLSPHWQSWK